MLIKLRDKLRSIRKTMPLRKWRQILKPYGFDVIKGKTNLTSLD